jgi:23S rRNA (uracil1939-C5)-methyltransferase
MTRDETFEVQIDDLSRGGAGVGRLPDGRVAFVPFTVSGDRVKIKLLSEKKQYVQGQLLEILKPSGHRTEAKCSVFGRCGGCEWQHIPYALQWETKVKGVLHVLGRFKLSKPPVVEEVPAERIWDYRNRIQLRGQGEDLGFFQKASRELVAIERCEIARPELNQALPEIRKQAKSNPNAYKVELEVNSKGKVQKSWNQGHGALGFRQIHDEQNENLRNWIVGNLPPREECLDLYGGGGNFSVPLAAKMGQVLCVDLSSPRIRPKGMPANISFHRQSVLNWILKSKEKSLENILRAAVLDPPREGLAKDADEIFSALEAMKVQDLILVGCEVDPWARDALKLLEKGYHLKKIGIFDLFPQTHHVEVAGVFVRA